MKLDVETEGMVKHRQFVRPAQVARAFLVIPIISIEPVGPVMTKTLSSGFCMSSRARGIYAYALCRIALVWPRGFLHVIFRSGGYGHHAVRLHNIVVRLRPQRLQSRSQLSTPERAGDFGLDR